MVERVLIAAKAEAEAAEEDEPASRPASSQVVEEKTDAEKTASGTGVAVPSSRPGLGMSLISHKFVTRALRSM